MKNLRSAKELTGYSVHATDGDIGVVRELYFDDADWRVKHLVVATKRWLPGKKILLPASAVEDILWEQRKILVKLTREEVRASPDIDTDKPVALQRRAETRARRNWALALAGEALTSNPEALEPPAFSPINMNGKPFDPHLRTTRVVGGLILRARDGSAGQIVDFIVDDDTWVIRYLVIELPSGRRVLLLPRLVKEIQIEEARITIDLPLRVVASGPPLDPSTLLTRQYEEAVLLHYQHDRALPSSP